MENLNLAGVGKRLVAYIIDAILLSIVLGIVFSIMVGGSIFSILAARSGNIDSDAADAATAVAVGASMLGFYAVSTVGVILYDALLTASVRQGTLGKMVMKIKVVNANGQALTTSEAFIRAIVKSISLGLCFLLFLVALFNKEEQMLHDMAVKDHVVND